MVNSDKYIIWWLAFNMVSLLVIYLKPFIHAHENKYQKIAKTIKEGNETELSSTTKTVVRVITKIITRTIFLPAWIVITGNEAIIYTQLRYVKNKDIKKEDL